jgi:hypothetical protein
MIDIDKIIPNLEQSRTADEKATHKIEPIQITKILPCRWSSGIRDVEKFERLKENLQEQGQNIPIWLWPIKKDLYESWKGNLTFLTAKELGWKTIDCIIDDISKNEALVKRISDHETQSDFTSIELENMVYELKSTGDFKSNEEIGRKICKTRVWVSTLINIKEFREELENFCNGRCKLSLHSFSTKTLLYVRRLLNVADGKKRDLSDVVKSLKIIQKENIKTSQVEDFVRDLIQWSDELREAVLNCDIGYFAAKNIVDQSLKHQNLLINKIKKVYVSKERIKKLIIESDVDFTELLQIIFNFIKNIEPTHINNIKDKNDKKWAIEFIKNSTAILLRLLLKLEVIKSSDFEHSIVKILNIDPKLVESIKSAGHYYEFSQEWTSDEEKKFREIMGKIKS